MSSQLGPSRKEFQRFIEAVLPNIDKLSASQQAKIHENLLRIRQLDELEDARNHLLPFIRRFWPGMVVNWHHEVICQLLEEMERGEILRAAVSTPPRYSKSTLLSIYFPAWVLGRNQSEQIKIIQAGNTAKLSQRFGRQTRNIIASDEYRELFPTARISPDSKAGGNFSLTCGSEYYAAGVGGALAGRGAMYLLVDDPYAEADFLSSNANDQYEAVADWFNTALQRQQPGGRVCVLHTRWSKQDLIGQIEERMHKSPNAEQYKIISIPALDDKDESTFPGYWKTPMLHQMRYTLMERTPLQWWAQYMQRPTSDSMAIIKREWWQKYEKLTRDGDYQTPACKYTLMVWDTAYTSKKRSNPSACTIWGIFDTEEEDNHVCLLHSFQKKMDLPELKDVTVDMVKEWQPDGVLVEAKSSGPWVLEEFRRTGIVAMGVQPKPGEDKMSRLNSIADIFASKKVHYIPTLANEETVQQCADFPAGSGDDLVDTVAYALRRIRQGGLVATRHDPKDDLDEMAAPVDRNYY